MKGVVLEIRDGEAAILLEDKTVKRIRCDCEVGDTVEIEEKGRITRFPKRATRWVAAAAAAIVLVTGGSYGYNNAYAYSYVTLDANPSIEYTLNRRNAVLSVSALNEDAVPIVEELNAGGVRGAALTEVLEETTALLYREEYLDTDDCMLISVISRGDSQRQALNAEIEEFNGRESPDIYVTNASMEEERSARSLGLSAGRYKLMEEVRTAEDSRLEDGTFDAGKMPVTELLERSGRRPGAEKDTDSVPMHDPDSVAELTPPGGNEREAAPSEETLGELQADGSAVAGPGNDAGGSAEMGTPSGEPGK